MKNTSFKAIGATVGVSLLMGLLAQNAKANTDDYFNTAVANGGSYQWSASSWSTAAGGPYTSAYVETTFAEFTGGGAGTTYTVNANFSTPGNGATGVGGILYSKAGTLNLGGSAFGLSTAGDSTTLTQNGYSFIGQGVFSELGGVLNITAVLEGTVGVNQGAFSGASTIGLLGVNTFTGGVLVNSSSVGVDYNNASSFGGATSQIGFNGTTSGQLINVGAAGVNIANAVQTVGTSGISFAGNAATFSGNFYLGGGSSVNTFINRTAGQTVTISGVLGNTTGNVVFAGVSGSSILLSGANTVSGGVVVGNATFGTGNNLVMGASGVLANTTSLTIAGGNLVANGYNQTFGTLGLTASGAITFLTGTEQLNFLNSSSVAWTAAQTLSLTGYAMRADGSTDGDLYVGVGGLTTAQLAEIKIDGESGAYITGASDVLGAGFLEVPEPSTLALGAMGGLAMLWAIKRRSKTA